MLVVQGAAITAAVTLFPSLLYLPSLLLGLVATNVIHNLSTKIRLNRDVNLFAIKVLSERLFGDEVSDKIRQDHESAGRRVVFDTYGPFAFAAHTLRAERDNKGAGHQRWIFGLSYFATMFVSATMLWMSANGCSSKECTLSGFSSISEVNPSGLRREGIRTEAAGELAGQVRCPFTGQESDALTAIRHPKAPSLCGAIVNGTRK